MNHSHLFSILALVCAPVAIVVCGLLAVVTYRARRGTAENLALTAELAERLSAAERKMEETVRQAADQAGRIVWLESRVRQGKQNSGPGINSGLMATTEVSQASPPSPPSMTERRHRVLSLARRGLDALSIAETLGVPYGEVELMISLSVAA